MSSIFGTRIRTLNFGRLFALTGIHLCIDMFGGMIPAILPRIQSDFGISFAMGGLFLSILNLCCNLFQLATGHLRENKRRPLFLPLGLVLASSIILIAALPRTSASVWPMIMLSVLTGFGIAVAHPESLRAVHAIRFVPSAMATAVFMAGGFVGYSAGNMVSSALVQYFGFNGLYILFLCPVVGVFLLRALRVKLAVEKTHVVKQGQVDTRLNFLLVFALAAGLTISTVVLVWLIPQRMEELGRNLTAGGFSNMVLGLCSAGGSFFWAWLANKRGESFCAVLALAFGTPFIIAYVFLIEHNWSVFVLAVGSLGAPAAFPLIVTMARHAKGFNLGRRLAFVVGGAWGLASLFPMFLGPVVEHTGVAPVLYFVPLGYVISMLTGIYITLHLKSLRA